MLERAADILHLRLYSDTLGMCVAGVERWPGKPRGPVTGYTTVPQLHN